MQSCTQTADSFRLGELLKKAYGWFYGLGIPIVAITLFIALFTGVKTGSGEGDYEKKYAAYPDMEYADLAKRLNELRDTVTKKMPALEYLDTLYELELMRGASMKGFGRAIRRHELEPRGYEHIALSFTSLSNDLATTNRDSLWNAGIDDQKRYQALVGPHTTKMNRLRADELPADWGPFFWWLCVYLGASRAFSLVHYLMRHTSLGNKAFLALATDWRFPRAILGFEYYVWKYPTEMSPIEQFRRAYRFATMILGACLTWGGAGLKVAFAQAAEGGEGIRRTQPREFTISGSSLYIDKYLGLDGAPFHPGAVVQSNVTVSHTSGVFADFWKSEPVGARHLRPNFGNEQDYTLGFASGIGLKAKLVLSATYFNVFPMLQMPRGDLLQLSARIERGVKLSESHTLAPYLWARSVRPLKGGQPVGGYFIHPGVSHSWSASKRLTLASYAESVRDSGAFGFNQGWVARFSSSLSVRIGKGFSLIAPVITMTKPLTDTRDGRKFERAIGFGFAFAH